VLITISTTLWDNVLTRHRFSTSGAAQLRADLAAICRVVDSAVGPNVAEAGLRRCIEGAQLIGLPVKGGKSQVTTQAKNASAAEAPDDWDAWGGEAEDVAEPKEELIASANGEAGYELGLWQVEERLFADNASARQVLDDLGMEVLTEAEARTMLGKRVELAG
jgi:hypothetical protein